MKLTTNQEVRSASNDTGSLNEFTISKADGLVLQVMPRRKDGSCTKKWAFKYKRSGKRRRIPLGIYPETTLEAARKAARALASQVDKGQAPRLERRSGTFSELLSEYLHAQRHIGLMKERERELRKDAVPVLGDMRPGEITSADIDRVLNPVLERSSVMAHKVAVSLKAIFNYALYDAPDLAERYNITTNPAAMFGRKRRGTKGRIRANPPRQRYLSDEEISAWWHTLACCNMAPLTKIGLRLVLATGQRPGEVRKAKRDDINIESSTWLNRNTKSGEDNLVYLPEPVRELFAEAMALSRNQYIFPDKYNPGEPVSNVAWPSAQRHMFDKWIDGMERAHVHDLRRTCATGMGRLSAPLPPVNVVLPRSSMNSSLRSVPMMFSKDEI